MEPTIWDRLAAPFEDTKTLRVAGRPDLDYVTAQAVEQRLDDVLGPDNWSAQYEVLSWQPIVVECRLGLIVGEARTEKVNVGEAANESEAAKAAYSDAFKRAARAFGVARYLALNETPHQPTQEQRTPPPQATTPEPGRPTFLADVKEAWNYDPDQMLDILGITMAQLERLNLEQQQRAWAKLKKTWEEAGGESSLPF